MDLIMTMFKPKQSMSPAKSIDTSNASARKRKHEQSPTRLSNGNFIGGSIKGNKVQKTTDQHGSKKRKKRGFTFEEVKNMIDNLLAQDKKKLDASINVGLKNIDISNFVAPGHEPRECKELIDKLVHHTRRIRTFEEVLLDIKTNLNKRSYTDIILQSSIGAPPKRPPSAYLMFHQKRFKELQEEGETMAAEIAKRVSEEWKTLSDYERAKYFRQHEEELRAYEENIEKLGLGKSKKPTRPKTAKTMYVRSKMAERGSRLPKDKTKLAKLKQQFEDDFDNADSDIRDVWISRYNEEHKRYVEEQLKYVADNPHLDRNDIIKTRPTKVKIVPPAAPRNALRMFISKKIPEGLEGQELKDTEAKLREKFDKLSTKKLLKYIKKAIKDKERYDAELEEFASEHPDFKLPQHKPNITQEQWRLYQSLVEHKPQLPAPTAYLHFCSSKIKNLEDPDQAPTERLRDASEAWKRLGTEGQTQVHKEHVEYIKKYIEEMEAWLGEQDEKRKEQLFREEPKSKPDYWRKRISRLEKCNVKKESQEAAKKIAKKAPDSDSESSDYSD